MTRRMTRLLLAGSVAAAPLAFGLSAASADPGNAAGYGNDVAKICQQFSGELTQGQCVSYFEHNPNGQQQHAPYPITFCIINGVRVPYNEC